MLHKRYLSAEGGRAVGLHSINVRDIARFECAGIVDSRLVDKSRR